MWVRGLKQGCRRESLQPRCVAPYVGAWIETTCTVAVRWQAPVAPYVGAWIETERLWINVGELDVAPYVGAWIETSSSSS